MTGPVSAGPAATFTMALVCAPGRRNTLAMFDATPLLRSYARHRLSRLSRMDPVSAQRRVLAKLLAQARTTRFGHDHGFAEIDGVESFQARVPLRRFEQMWQDYWQPAFPQIGGQTWPGPIPFFAETSGTSSGTTKYVPVSRQMVHANRRAALDVLCFHMAARPQSRVLGGLSFLLGGNPEMRQLAPGVRSGDLSGIAAAKVSWWASPYYYPQGALARIADWEAKIDAACADSLGRDIRMVGGTASWLLLAFDRLGELAGRPGTPVGVLYPKLELVVYGGVDFAPYRGRFQAHLARGHADLREVYAASEGFIAAADRGVGEGLRLMVDNGLFFEFVPPDELESASPTRHWLATAEVGVDYAVVLSTNAGCWGHVLGDTVRFVSLNPPRLLVTGRISTQLSAFGEHLTGAELDRAVTAAADAIGAAVQDFSVTAVLPDDRPAQGGHCYIVEFDRMPDAAALARFTEVLDRTLAAGNDDYRVHRAGDFGMAPPQVRAAPPGTFTAWMKARGKLGGQNKVPRVITNAALWASLEAELE
ncbi:MAG: GH3 auxin-responsive promoter family protein [Rhodospirillaceae bacterium]|nr:GH3 auxin-responsive promoter family protein [Rhodospirillaceae bacterium]